MNNISPVKKEENLYTIREAFNKTSFVNLIDKFRKQKSNTTIGNNQQKVPVDNESNKVYFKSLEMAESYRLNQKERKSRMVDLIATNQSNTAMEFK